MLQTQCTYLLLADLSLNLDLLHKY
jgi:hypothetical protein